MSHFSPLYTYPPTFCSEQTFKSPLNDPITHSTLSCANIDISPTFGRETDVNYVFDYTNINLDLVHKESDTYGYTSYLSRQTKHPIDFQEYDNWYFADQEMTLKNTCPSSEIPLNSVVHCESRTPLTAFEMYLNYSHTYTTHLHQNIESDIGLCSTLNTSKLNSKSKLRKRRSFKKSNPCNSSNTIYNCIDCNKQLEKVDNLRSHQKNHSSERPFNCQYCTLSFHRTYDLNRHINTHFGIKPYSCSFCTKPFSRLDALNRHVKNGGLKGKPCSGQICKFIMV